jgi:hypothetical protein
MTRKTRKPTGEARRPYQTPELRRVRLVPDEAVLASCKNTRTAGPTGMAGKCIGSPSTCFQNAS